MKMMWEIKNIKRISLKIFGIILLVILTSSLPSFFLLTNEETLGAHKAQFLAGIINFQVNFTVIGFYLSLFLVGAFILSYCLGLLTLAILRRRVLIKRK
jgi:formate hydrogenlyase subunit 3/multisubunit Na+/H+ antiporter MnhD subunit